MGLRIRELRQQAGLTQEKLAYESGFSKGHLSNIEKGLVRPTIETLRVLAEGLEVLPLDVLTFPDEDERQRLIDQTRSMSNAEIRRLTADGEGRPRTSASRRTSRRS